MRKASLSSLQSLSEQSRGFDGLEEKFRALPCSPLVVPAFEFQLCGGLGSFGQQGVSASVCLGEEKSTSTSVGDLLELLGELFFFSGAIPLGKLACQTSKL